jgi:hypothetical protein
MKRWANATQDGDLLLARALAGPSVPRAPYPLARIQLSVSEMMLRYEATMPGGRRASTGR